MIAQVTPAMAQYLKLTEDNLSTIENWPILRAEIYRGL